MNQTAASSTPAVSALPNEALASEATAAIAPRGSREEQFTLSSPKEKVVVYAVLIAVTAVLLGAFIGIDIAAFRSTSDVVDKGTHLTPTTLLVMIQAESARNALVLRTSVMFLGVLVVVLGAFLVVKGVEASFRLGLAFADRRSSLTTSSPGLVMITLGIALMIVGVLNKSEIKTEVDADPVDADHSPAPQETKHAYEKLPPP